MTGSTVRVAVLGVWTLLMVSLIQHATHAKFVGQANLDLLGSNLMDSRWWEPAEGILSSTFAGTDIHWMHGTGGTWTLPGTHTERDQVEHKGKERPNHQQFTARTKRQWGSFHLQVYFKFDGDEGTETRLEEFGNSGIYIHGLYEVQIINTSRFLAPGPVAQKNLHRGRVEATVGGRRMEAPANKCLCGSIYGGGNHLGNNPMAGATTDRLGRPVNFCNPNGQWNRLDIFFTPPTFADGRKTHYATVATLINGKRVYYGGKDKYGIPRPTGSQWNKPDRTYGPIVIQDHGSQVSFREMRIDSTWRPGADWAVAVSPQKAPPATVAMAD